MKLFAALKKIRAFEKAQLPFLKSIVDFDILIEIGHAEEHGWPARRWLLRSRREVFQPSLQLTNTAGPGEKRHHAI